MKQEAQQAAQEAARQQQQAEAARQAALAQQQVAENQAQQAAQARAAAEAETAKARQSAAQAEAEKAQLRAQLLQQLNAVLQTRDSARGLIVNMSDVLFDTGSADLKPGAREKLAKISGIVLAHPGLSLQIEGHTDSVGSDDFNQELSGRRADGVRDYLAQEGVPASSMSAKGFGKTQPVASNDTADGRQRNRRVELVVNGAAIGNSTSSAAPASLPPQGARPKCQPCGLAPARRRQPPRRLRHESAQLTQRRLSGFSPGLPARSPRGPPAPQNDAITFSSRASGSGARDLLLVLRVPHPSFLRVGSCAFLPRIVPHCHPERVYAIPALSFRL